MTSRDEPVQEPHNGGAVVWQGFDFEWLRTPHRLNAIGSTVVGAWDMATGVLSGSHRARFSVGRVPDQGVARTWLTGIRSPSLLFWDGEAVAHLEADIGHPASARGDRVEVALPPGLRATVILRGFELLCRSCPVGLHTQGFGVSLSEVARTPRGLSFVPETFVHASNSPDPITSGRGGYAYDVHVHYTVIAGPEDQVAFDEHPDDTPLRHRHTHRRGGPPLEVVHRALDPLERSVLAIRGFRWQQLHRGRWGRDGRFVRRLQAFLPQVERADGELRCRPQLHFSNRGAIAYAVDAEHHLWTTLIRHRDDRPHLPHERLEVHLPTGIGEGAAATADWVLS